MNKPSKVRWYNASNPSQALVGGDKEKSSGKHYIPPKEKIREWAHESKEGGRAVCEICGVGFAMYYIRFCRISAFKSGHVCLDCKKEHNLQAIK